MKNKPLQMNLNFTFYFISIARLSYLVVDVSIYVSLVLVNHIFTKLSETLSWIVQRKCIKFLSKLGVLHHILSFLSSIHLQKLAEAETQNFIFSVFVTHNLENYKK